MTLPEPLSNLIPLLDAWSTADISLRLENLNAASDDELSHLVNTVLPHLPEIDEYLITFGDHPFDDTVRRLLRLVECALEAKHELEAREATADGEVSQD